MMLGLKDPRPGAIPLRFSTYCDFSKLPTPPETFGHMSKINYWGMLANDKYGCCAWSGAEHMTMMSAKLGGGSAPFNDAATVTNYAKTGFQLLQPNGQPWPIDPSTGLPDNPTDQGTDLGALAKIWLQDGIIDALGRSHKAAVIVDLNPGDLREIWLAQYLFGSVGLGYALPDTAQDQTQRGLPWDVVPGATIEGGHFVPSFSRYRGQNIGVTWGQAQVITPRFIQTYNNQGLVVFSRESLRKGRSLEGFDDATLLDDAAEMAKAA